MRIAILSDIHEDYRSLKKVFKKINRKGCDLNVCLGDISGFSNTFYRYRKTRNASACLDLIRENCEIIVPGNHDLHAAGKIPDQPAVEGHEYWPHEEDLDPGYDKQELAYLADLPEYVILPAVDYNILLSHYAEPNISGLYKGFYSSGKEFEAHFQLMNKLQCKLGFTGHVHARGFHLVYPQQFRQNGYSRLQLKEFPVVIGIPPVTHHKYRTGFCIFDTTSCLLQVIKHY